MMKKLLNEFKESNVSEILTFDDYLEDLEKNPRKHLRNSAMYIKEVFDYYGRSSDGSFNLFLKEDEEFNKVYGNKKIQHLLYNSIQNFIEQGYNNKFILLAGPNGSAKTTFINKIMKACEDFSLTEQGSLYTFSWIFPVSKNSKINGTSTLGLNPNKDNEQNITSSFAKLKENDIASVISSDLKDHPFLLIPKKLRQKMIDELLEKKDKDLLEKLKKTYFYKGDVSQKSKEIFDTLLKEYGGDYEQVLNHVRVERYNISKRYSRSAVTIEPQMHVDAKMQQVTMDKKIQNLPTSIQALNLFQHGGELIYANRGILEYSDLLKRHLDAYKYLLMTIENKTINMQGILVELDILFMGSSNEIHYEAFKQHPDYNSFKARFKVIHVPYLTDFKDEQKIYEDHLKVMKNKSRFQAHAIEAFSLWNVMSRLHEPRFKSNFEFTEELETIIPKINCLTKALLYAKEFSELNEIFTEEELKELKSSMNDLKREWNTSNPPFYEGRFGMSPRESKELLFELAHQNQMVTYIEVLNYLKQLNKKVIYGEKEADIVEQIEANQQDNSFKNNELRIELLKDFFNKKFDSELRDSLGLVDSLAYESYITEYIQGINALLKGEKILNKVTKKYEEVNIKFLNEFEKKIGISDVNEFRSNLLNKVGVFFLENPDSKIVYSEIFKDSLYKKLKENFIDSQKETIKKLVGYLDYYDHKNPEKSTNLDKEKLSLINNVIENMKNKYHYSHDTTLYIIREIYKR